MQTTILTTHATVETPTLESSYLALVEFLMLSKISIIEYAENHELTAMQAITLLLLDQPRPMNYYKKLFHCDAGNITGLTDGLEEKGLARRTDHPKDRRIKLIELTRKGAGVRTSILNGVTGPRSFIASKLSPAELKAFIALTQKITS